MKLFIKKTISKLLNMASIELRGKTIVNSKNHQLQSILKRYDISLIIDVGANTGQFARGMIDEGFREKIVSFEPIRECHNILVRNAKKYKNWHVFRNCALGSKNKKDYINISKNFVSNSILEYSNQHLLLEKDIIYQKKTKK